MSVEHVDEILSKAPYKTPSGVTISPIFEPIVREYREKVNSSYKEMISFYPLRNSNFTVRS